MDRAGVEYWEGTWARNALPPAIDPDSPNLSACVDRSTLACFDAAFAALGRPAPTVNGERARVIEVGSGNSVWLPLLAKRFGAQVTGLDYAASGVATCRAILEREGVAGDVREGDVFAPPTELVGAFDLAYSVGVVEHFEDTTHAVRAVGALARPGGVVLTLIPNLSGTAGTLCRVISPNVFRAHVPLGLRALRAAHEAAGLEILDAHYVHSVNYGMIDLGAPIGPVRDAVRGGIKRAFVELSRLVWLVEKTTRPLTPGRALSPTIAVLARRR
jgi:2-polyprenyl-3-methyl-5-hydroxy-6-metoxy-1,4-benzoquinol methylase